MKFRKWLVRSYTYWFLVAMITFINIHYQINVLGVGETLGRAFGFILWITLFYWIIWLIFGRKKKSPSDI